MKSSNNTELNREATHPNVSTGNILYIFKKENCISSNMKYTLPGYSINRYNNNYCKRN